MRSAHFSRILATVVCLCLWSQPAFGQKSGAESEPAEPSENSSTDESKAGQFYQEALAAFDQGEYEKALFELDRAWRLEKDLVFLYRRILVLEAMDRNEMALELLEDNREALLETAGVNDLFVVEERLRSAVKDEGTVEDPRVADDAEASPPSRTAINWLGPIALGAAGIGLSIWGATFFSESCLLEGQSGCLKTEKAESGKGAALIGVGVAAIAAGVVWFVLTSPNDDSEEPKVGAFEITSDGVAIRF